VLQIIVSILILTASLWGWGGLLDRALGRRVPHPALQLVLGFVAVSLLALVLNFFVPLSDLLRVVVWTAGFVLAAASARSKLRGWRPGSGAISS
jgi:hypothetical protein